MFNDHVILEGLVFRILLSRIWHCLGRGLVWPGRYTDLQLAVRQRKLRDYLDRFRIGGVMIGPRNIGWTEPDRHAFMDALANLGYVNVTLENDPIQEFLRSDISTRVDRTVLVAAPRETSPGSRTAGANR